MNRKWITFSISVFFIIGILLGFSFIRESNDDPTGSRNTPNPNPNKNNNQIFQNDNSGNLNEIFGTPYYIDNFDGANDTTSLKNRGYKIYYRGGGTQGAAPTWFQGSLFPAFNGPSTGYVAANFQVLSGINNIDSWLVLPKKSISPGDSLIFYARSDSASTYPDSIRVMYSAVGDSTPEASWTELGRFKAITTGSWQRKAFGASSAGANARFAIRYNVVNGGPGGTNSNYIGIDAITLESPTIANDMAASSINSPTSAIVLPSPIIAPKASFKNNGSSSQSNIPVTYKISGPVNYTSTKNIISLSAGATTQVIFDSTFSPPAGNYSITIYSSLTTDGNRINDTLKSTFSASDPNYGSSAGYFYANSTSGALPAPSQPQYCWKDTTGSVGLALNATNLQPGITTGDLDDGYWKVALPSGKRVMFFGSNYDTVRIGTNGIIAFQSFTPNANNWNPPTGGIPGGTVLNAVYPLWNDFDFSDNTVTSTSRVSYKVAGNLLIVTYDRAPIYGGDPGEYISIQISIDVSASPSSNSRIVFQYADTTGGKTGAAFVADVNNNTLQNHLIGIQNSAGTAALQYRFRNSTGIVTAGKIFNSPSGSLAVEFGPEASQLNNSCTPLNLTSRLQLIQLTRRDTLSVSLRQSTSPYSIVETKKIVYDSTNGNASVPFNLAVNGTSYFIYVSHRNSISTWSALPVLCTAGSLTYDFTTSVSQAFGNNMILVGGKASIYTGDVSRDGCTNLTDFISIYNDASIFLTGSYLSTDLNYDGIADLTDFITAYNNATFFICEMQPAGPVDNSEFYSKVQFNYEKDNIPDMGMSKKEWIRKFGK